MKLKHIFILFLTLLMTQMSLIAQNYLTKLSDKTEFDLLKGLPLSSKYGEVEAVKIVYEIESKDVYFINNKDFEYHHEFCQEELNFNGTLGYFNKYHYSESTKRRKYLLGNINYFPSLDKYILELSPSDKMAEKEIKVLYKAVQKAVYFEDNLFFFLNSLRLKQADEAEKLKFKTINSNEIYDNQQYQSLSNGICYGFLKRYTLEEIDKANIQSNEIVLLEGSPLFLPIVAGVITNEFQTPLSHLSILGKNRKIPIAAQKDIFEDSLVLSLVGKHVRLEVNEDKISIQLAKINYNPFFTEKEPINLKKNLKRTGIYDIKGLYKNSAKFVGTKAANFAVLNQLSKTIDFNVPEHAFAIPFYYYDRHIHSNEINILIDEMLIDYLKNEDQQELRKNLKNIRKAIKKTPINQELLKLVTDKIKEQEQFTKFRFRSSTNAEDLEGFSGAGLYNSKSGSIIDSTKTVEKAIKNVWSSLWNYNAFIEREYFNIEQCDVVMGILVHRSFPDEVANGVAITKNLYRPNTVGSVINVQKGEISVVDPDSGITCDQIICYSGSKTPFYNEKEIVEIITNSNINDGKLVMTKEEIIHLTEQLEHIKIHFYEMSYPAKKYLDYGLDLEFKLDGKGRELYIKQVRYFND